MIKKVVLCPCGDKVYVNVWKNNHLPKCRLAEIDQDKYHLIRNVLEIKTNQQFAWLKSEGQDALGNRDWYISVINGDTNLDDWSFESPRPPHHIRQIFIEKYKKARLGSNNPMVISRIKNYNINDLKDFAKKEFNSGANIGTIKKKLLKQFPDFSYQFADIQPPSTSKERGHSKNNLILSMLLDIPLETLVSEAAKRRGKQISVGQRGSEKFMRIASAIGASLISTRRVSAPQERLFDIIQKYDEDSVMEHKLILGNGRVRAVDIYSPKINAFIEMHGRVFHDRNKTRDNLVHIVARNEIADGEKKEFAESRGIGYYVFWDDEEKTWKDEVAKLYEKIKN
jgi:hypothetical protein